MDRPHQALVLVPALAAALAALPAAAQRVPVGTTVVGGSITGLAQFEAGLDRGGDVEMAGAIVSAQAYHQFTPTFGAGASLNYTYEDWSFSNVRGLRGAAPWSEVHRPQIGVPMVWTPQPGTTVLFNPTVSWAYEQGADTSDAVVWGALFGATRQFTPDLSLGLGVGVFDDLEETRAFPVLLVDWRIDDRWRLANPFRAGPAGGAGLELAYKLNDAWEFAGGGTWRSVRFRLDDDGAVPGGIGESRSVPLFLRTTWLASRDVRLDFHVGAAVGGNLKLMDRAGNDLADEDVDAAPFVGVTLRTRF